MLYLDQIRPPTQGNLQYAPHLTLKLYLPCPVNVLCSISNHPNSTESRRYRARQTAEYIDRLYLLDAGKHEWPRTVVPEASPKTSAAFQHSEHRWGRKNPLRARKSPGLYPFLEGLLFLFYQSFIGLYPPNFQRAKIFQIPLTKCERVSVLALGLRLCLNFNKKESL